MNLRSLVRPVALAAALLAVGGIAYPQATHAATLVNTTFPLTGLTLVNPCNGDPVTFVSGDLHLLGHQDLGNFNNYGFDSNFENATAVDQLTGQTYQVSENDHFNGTGGSGAFITQDNSSATFISQGAGPNFVSQFIQHITIDDNGNATATFTDFSAQCQG